MHFELEEENVVKRIWSGERGYKKIFAGGELIFNRGWKYKQKSHGEKVHGNCEPQKNYDIFNMLLNKFKISLHLSLCHKPVG